MRITEVLKHGRENATRADVLAAKLETTPRGLRSLIMKARDAGEIILYAPGGYGGDFPPPWESETPHQKKGPLFPPPAPRRERGRKKNTPRCC